MLKAKRNGEWRTELNKTERKKLDESCVVLSDLADLHPTVAATLEHVRRVIRCIDGDGCYSEQVEKANA